MLKCNMKNYIIKLLVAIIFELSLSLIIKDKEQVLTIIMITSVVLIALNIIHIFILIVRLFHDGPSETNQMLNTIIFIAPFKKMEILMLSIIFAIFVIVIMIAGNYILLLK